MKNKVSTFHHHLCPFSLSWKVDSLLLGPPTSGPSPAHSQVEGLRPFLSVGIKPPVSDVHISDFPAWRERQKRGDVQRSSEVSAFNPKIRETMLSSPRCSFPAGSSLTSSWCPRHCGPSEGASRVFGARNKSDSCLRSVQSSIVTRLSAAYFREFIGIRGRFNLW